MALDAPTYDRARARRQGILTLVVVNALVLLTGVVVSIDLRRLQTPGGTALRWVEAAVLGNCSDYLDYSVAGAGSVETRSREELCQDLRSATATDRAMRIGLQLAHQSRSGADATVELTLSRDGRPTALTVHLVRRDGRWRVLRDATTCDSVGCA